MPATWQRSVRCNCRIFRPEVVNDNCERALPAGMDPLQRFHVPDDAVRHKCDPRDRDRLHGSADNDVHSREQPARPQSYSYCYSRFGSLLDINPLYAKLNPICHLLALLGAHPILHVSRIRDKSLTLRLLMSYIYGAPILDVSRSHTTTQHSR